MRSCPVRRAEVFIILDIDGTLLSACRRFSLAHPFTAGGAIGSQRTLRYYDVERGRMFQDCLITTRPYLGEFLQTLGGGAMNTSRVTVQLCLFTHNTFSYANAIAEQVLRPLISFPFAFIFGSSNRRCYSLKGRGKSVAVSGSPNTSLLIDDSCGSFVPDEFFSGHGALVESFFSGKKPWGLEDEMDDVLSCNASCIHGETDKFPLGDWADVSLYALISEFVAFWHDADGNNSSTTGNGAANCAWNLLTDSRAARYREWWLRYHAPMEERLQCINPDIVF